MKVIINKNFGTDKIYLTGFQVEKIYWDVVDDLVEKEKIRLINDKKHSYFKSLYRLVERDFSYLNISDYKNLKHLTISTTIDNRKRSIGYVHMEINNSNKTWGNLHLNSLEDIKSEIDSIMSFLEKDFGIKLKIGELKIKQIELTKNIYLDYPFDEYALIIKTIMSLYSKKYVPVDYGDKNSKEIKTFLVKNKSVELKIYDKTNQMKENKYDIRNLGNILRIEYTLTGAKLNEVFKKTKLNSFTDMELKDWFYKEIETNIRNKFEKNIKQKQSEYNKLLREIRDIKLWKKVVIKKLNNHIIGWAKNKYTNFYPISIIDGIISKKSGKNASRSLRSFREDENYLLFLNNTERLNELFEKLFSSIEE